jgi:hypothetical protein
MKIGDSVSGALFSDDHKYRFVLWRIWDRQSEALMFIGLNPSTANEHRDDPTIIRLANFAKAWHFGGLCAVNLHPIVSANPDILYSEAGRQHFTENDEAIKQVKGSCSTSLVGWGEWGKEFTIRVKAVLDILGDPVYCLKVNKSGEPCHPLYLPRDSKLIPYTRKEASHE